MTAPAPITPFLRLPLATPHLAEALRASLGQELENYLLPLVDYCEGLPAEEALDLAEFRHGYQLRQALDALLRYDAQAEQLLTYYRQALTAAQQLAAARVPSLDQVLGVPASDSLPPSHAESR